MSKTAPIKPFNGKPTSSLQGTDISPAQAYKMTNYNERLYEIIDKHRHDVDMDFSADIRHYKNTNETVDGITSLIKELVEEAKPEHIDNSVPPYGDTKYNRAIDEFEQNLLKALEEV